MGAILSMLQLPIAMALTSKLSVCVLLVTFILDIVWQIIMNRFTFEQRSQIIKNILKVNRRFRKRIEDFVNFMGHIIVHLKKLFVVPCLVPYLYSLESRGCKNTNPLEKWIISFGL